MNGSSSTFGAVAGQRRRRESMTSSIGDATNSGNEGSAGNGGGGGGSRSNPGGNDSKGNVGQEKAGPKRGARACTNCRRGKNRCEGDNPCRRCAQHGLNCIFEKPSTRKAENHSAPGIIGDVEGRMNHIESSVSNLANSQGQMQSTLSQILAALSQNQYNPQPQLVQPEYSPIHLSHQPGNDAKFSFSSMDSPSSGQYSQFGNTRPSPSQSSGIQHNQYYGNTIQALPGSGSTVPFSPATAELINQAVAATLPPGADDIDMQGPTNGGFDDLSARQNGRRNTAGVSFADTAQTHDSYTRRFSTPANPQLSLKEEPLGNPDWPTLETRNGRRDESPPPLPPPRKFPTFHGFAPPPHRYAQYGIVVPSTAPSSEDESEDTLPRSTLDAPIEALQALANAADQAAQDERAARTSGFLSPPRALRMKMRKRKRPEPTPRNAFPDVITKGLVAESEARELWKIFFSGCQYFVPMFDEEYDIFDSFCIRTPFSFDGMLAVAAKIRAGTSPPSQSYYRCLEEAQGIARSTLFGPVVRKEAVMAVLILAAWSQNGWLPSGHALRMGLDMQLHKALEKLADVGGALSGKMRTDSEERDLVVAARIWLNVYLNDHIISLGTGRPLMLRDDESVKNARLLLSHPMCSETDLRLISCVELVGIKVRVYETLHPLRHRVDHSAISFVRRIMLDLHDWHGQWHTIHLRRHSEGSVLVQLLKAELCYAQLWTACVALRGCAFDKLTFEQRELAFTAKDAALACLATYQGQTLRRHLKYAVHETMVQISFSCTFLLKVAILFPSELPPAMISKQVSQLAELLSECAAERYALTLRLMLRSFRRKMGETTRAPGSPRAGSGTGDGDDAMANPLGLQSLLAGETDLNGDFGMLDDLGPFNFPLGFSPSALPPWITETNMTDLGLPWEGSDSIFLPPELANMFLPTPTTWQLSEEPGAEAW